MQVNAIDDNISSVTLGQSIESKSFKVSSNAAFFQTLSKSLYSMPELAVMREVVCNSWDAHISAGITDKPVEITTDDLTISFRDFGTGIADEMMSEIYATYGASTKTNDSSVTGGFGLGCKSPFAVTDSFQVVSHFAGKKSTYSVVLVDEETGLPSMSCIAQVPTSETGIEVSITFIDSLQARDCIKHLESVIRCGDIKAKIDGILIPTLNLDFTEGSYVTIDRATAPVNNHDASVLIRYGNAVYPVNSDDKEITRVVNTLSRLIEFTPVHSICQHKSNKIMIQAAPDSISVAPSREVLSYQTLTKESLINLCLETVNVIVHKLKEDWKSYQASMLNNIDLIIDGFSSYFHFRNIAASNVREYASNKLSNNERFAAEYMEKTKLTHTHQFGQQVKNYINKCMIKKLLTLDTPYSKHIALLVYWETQGFTRSKWRDKNRAKLDKILVSKVHEIVSILPKKINSIYDPIISRGNTYPSASNLRQTLLHYRHLSQRSYSILTYTTKQPIVALSVKANINLSYRLCDCPAVNADTGMWLHDVIPRKKSEQQARIKYWESKGYLVVNLEDKHAWDPETKPKDVIAKVEPEDVWVSLFIHHLNFYGDTTAQFTQRTPDKIFKLGEMPKGIEPKYYLSNFQNYEWFLQNLRYLHKSLIQDVIKHTVVSKSATTTNACKKLGLKPLHDLLDTYLMKGAVMYHKLKGKSENQDQIERIHKRLRALNLSFPMIKLLPKVEQVTYTAQDLRKYDNVARMVFYYNQFWRNSRTRKSYPCAKHKEVLALFNTSSSEITDNKQLEALREIIVQSPISSILNHDYIPRVAGTQEGDLLREYLKVTLKRLKAKVYAN